MRRAMLSMVLLLLVGACLACSGQRTVCYQNAHVVQEENALRLRAGNCTVLGRSYWASFLLPMAAKGPLESTLYIEIEPSLLKSGAVLKIPQPGVSTFVWALHPPVRKETPSCTGWVRLIDVSANKVQAEVSVEAFPFKEEAWKYHGTDIYPIAPIPIDDKQPTF